MRRFLPFFYGIAFIAAFQTELAAKETHPFSPIGQVAEIEVHPKTTAIGRGLVTIKDLKAVIIVGDVDGDRGSTTRSYIKNMKEVADHLKRLGATVSEFYTPNNDWEKIKSEARSAQLILYSGHGVGSTLSPPYIQSKVGGFALKDTIISPERIQSELNPQPGAVVIFVGACFTAGNMSYDMGKIKYGEAKKRVIQYARPFVESGYSAYFATWSHETAKQILTQLLSNSTYGDTYQISYDTTTLKKVGYPDSKYQLWINSEPYRGSTVYNYAFVGSPNYKFSTVFKESLIGVSDENPSIRNEQADQELLYAAYKGDAKKARSSLLRGANPDTTHDGWTPLMFASYYGHNEIVRLLIEKGANINASVDGWSAMNLAESRNHHEIASFLRSKGAFAYRARSMPHPPPVLEEK